MGGVGPKQDSTASPSLVVGERDGYGLFGVLDDDAAAGLLCHECGSRFRHLGLHAWKGHGLSAAQYRDRHGLPRARGLLTEAVAETIRSNATGRYTRDGPLALSRDPGRAAAARLELGSLLSPAAAAARDLRTAALGRSTRRRTVVTCQWCGVQFCPLRAAKRRRFCSRSCANKHNRRAGRTTR